MIDRELEAEILRLYHAEHWPIETIAKQHVIHHSVVRRVLAQDGRPVQPRTRPRLIDPYLPFLREMLAKYPKITASRLYDMVRERGYPGRSSQFRGVIAELRPRRCEAYLRLRTLPGEQAQVDWAHFGRIAIGRASRPLMGFVMVLSYSRAVFLRFFLSQRLESFLYGHEAAFRWFGGASRCCKYDNLRSVVLERVGKAIRFHPVFLDFAAHWRFEPRPVAVARGNEKGRVERAIRYIRTSFFEARRYRDLDDLNAQALTWCKTTALDRAWPEDKRRTVRDVFDEERRGLLALPDNPFPCDVREVASVGKTPYVRFDGNDYSVPHALVGRTVVVMASLDTVRVLDGRDVVAAHARSFDKGEQIEDASHIEQLVEAKRELATHRTADVLSRSAPASTELFAKMADQGLRLRRATSELLELLRTFGDAALEDAIREALAEGAHHVQAVRHILDRNRRSAGRRPALPLELPDDPRVRHMRVTTHDLKTYDFEPSTPPEIEKEDASDAEREDRKPC